MTGFLDALVYLAVGKSNRRTAINYTIHVMFLFISICNDRDDILVKLKSRLNSIILRETEIVIRNVSPIH